MGPAFWFGGGSEPGFKHFADQAWVGDTARRGLGRVGSHEGVGQADVDAGEFGVGLPRGGFELGEAEVGEVLVQECLHLDIGGPCGDSQVEESASHEVKKVN